MAYWRPQAVADRKNIADYIARDNPIAAVELVDLLIETAGRLDANPKLGRVGRIRGTREWVAHPHYVIFYRTLGAPAHVEILRILHTSRQWP